MGSVLNGVDLVIELLRTFQILVLIFTWTLLLTINGLL